MSKGMKVLIVVLVVLVFIYFVVQMKNKAAQTTATPTLASTITSIKTALGIS